MGLPHQARAPRRQVQHLGPHNEHWSVLPILLWRAIFSVAHLTTYWPYLVPLLLAHVAVVHLVWRRCLHEGVNPWLANALALLFALIGAGAEDLAWAFQIGFVGSVMLGLLAIEVAELAPAGRAGRALSRAGAVARLPEPVLRDCLVGVLAVVGVAVP